MIDENPELEMMKLKLLLKKKINRINHLNDEKTIIAHGAMLWRTNYEALYEEHDRLKRKFEANFKFHEYIKDVLDQTADLMENYDAVREQKPPVQEGVRAAGRKRRTRKSNGAPAGA
jgi:predicted  nucleic acid-binding Zn-ribbon protein